MARAENLNDPKHAPFRCVREYAKTSEMTIITDYLRSSNAGGGVLEREMISQALELRAGNCPKDSGRPAGLLENSCAAMGRGSIIFGDSETGVTEIRRTATRG
jgi:hypothetical protein